jgi:hypothetical protein
MQLDHADEAKLNKLVAARQKKNDRGSEHKRNNQDKRHRLQKLVDESWACKVCNACSFDTAEKAEAHETLCAVKNSFDTK